VDLRVVASFKSLFGTASSLKKVNLNLGFIVEQLY